MSTSAYNMSAIRSILEKGFPTQKLVHFNSVQDVIKYLSKNTGSKISQLSSGELAVIQSSATAATETATTGMTTYAGGVVNISKTTIAAGEKVITATGKIKTLESATTGYVVSGSSNLATAGSLGTVTELESAVVLTPKTVVICAVAAICGFAIGDAIAGKIAAEIDGRNFDWSTDTIVGNVLSSSKNQIVTLIDKSGVTRFSADLMERLYQEMIKIGFFTDETFPFNPEKLKKGEYFVYSDFESPKTLGLLQLDLMKKAIDVDSFLEKQKQGDYPNLPVTKGYNERLFKALYEIINGIDDKLEGIGSFCCSVWLGIKEGDYTDYATLYFTMNIRRSNQKGGRYEEINNPDFPQHPYKRMYYENTNKDVQYYLRNFNSPYGYITGYAEDNWTVDYKIEDSGVYTTDKQPTWTTGSYTDISMPILDTPTLWRYVYATEVWNMGTITSTWNKKKLSDAVVPDTKMGLRENFPDWAKKAMELGTPTKENAKKKKQYLPGKVHSPTLDPNNTATTSQSQAQSGINTEADTSDARESIGDVVDSGIKPDVKPEPGVVIPEVIIPDPKPIPEPKPIKPTPKPEIPTYDLSSSSMFSIYSPSLSELNAFAGFLWSGEFVDNVVKLFQDPMNAIIGLHQIYTDPIIGTRTNIYCGKIDSHVNSRIVAQQYKTINCGSITINEYFGDARDYDFTNISIYLPFIGIKQLNSKDVVGGKISVDCIVDVVTGTILYNISVTKKGVKQLLYTFNGNCAVQLPITAYNYSNIISNTIGIVASGVATIASGGSALPLLVGSAGRALTSSKAEVQQSNTISSNAGAMGIKKPYLIINRQNAYTANAYHTLQGYPSNINVSLSTLSGYTRVKECHLEGIPATDEELEEIYTLLKQGVIL